MKKTILLPLFLGLLFAGCSRTNTESKVSANDQPDRNNPTYDATAATAGNDAANQAQVATNSSPAPAAGRDPLADTAKSATDAPVAAAPTPADATSVPAPNVANTDNNAKPDIAARVAEWKLSADDIRTEFDRTGRIERSKNVGAGEPTGPMDDVLTTQINSKFKDDSTLSGLSLNVSADKGVVTLTGSAQTLDQIGQAIALSLDTPGVTKSISEIKLEKSP